MLKILVAEDDEKLNKIISTTFKDNGFNIVSADNGKNALEKFENEKFDMILTDIMMPIMDGFELTKNVRIFDKNIPILFMTAKDDLSSKEKGFEIGIDDYIVKPFDVRELILRVNAILRRAKIANAKQLTIGNFKMNIEEHSASYNEEEITLTVREFDVLFKLLSFPKKPFTRSALMDEFWDYDSSATSRTVDVCMAKLRDKTSHISEFTILTVHGLGYKVVINEK